MSEHKEVFARNMARVNGLLELYNKLKTEKIAIGKDFKYTDILRTAVVFLHSSFEEYFRGILIKWIPEKANEETLKAIPIALKAGRKGEKIYLNDLSHYRGMSIDDIIKESVKVSLSLVSFNSKEEIVQWCSKVGITSLNADALDRVNEAVARRHKIVHEADTDRNPTTSAERLRAISPSEIQRWIQAYQKLVEDIDGAIILWEGK